MARGKAKPVFQRSHSGPSLWLWLGLSLVVVLMDQFTKVLIQSQFELGQGLSVTSFFNLIRAHNPGAAFSFLSNAGGWQRWFFTGIAVFATLMILWMLRSHAAQKIFSCALSLILGGAVGNLIDRLLHGHVIDFLDFHWSGWHFPAFNVADSAICLGAALLLFDEWLRVRRGR